jgi:hypothetical protein
MPFFSRGTMKPPLGAQINPDHPFASGHIFSLFCNEGSGTTLAPNVICGSAPPLVATVNGNLTWASNVDGAALSCNAANQWLQIGTNAGSVLPTTAMTIVAVRRKLDTTVRTGTLFNCRSVAFADVDIYLPYSDGVVYWAFGGGSSPNQLGVSGLSFPTTRERWVFTAGPQGSAIWRNGVKVGSQSTAISRTATTNDLLINKAQFAADSGDLQELNFFSVFARQWSDDLCQWWSAEPYAHLYTEATRTYQFFGVGTGGAILKPTHYYAQQRQQAL